MKDARYSLTVKGLLSMSKSKKWGPPLRALFSWLVAAFSEDEEGDETEIASVAEALPDETEHLKQKSESWRSLFDQLEGLDCGKVIVGRRRFKTRFKWSHKPSTLQSDLQEEDFCSAQEEAFYSAKEPDANARKRRVLSNPTDAAAALRGARRLDVGRRLGGERVVHTFPLRYDWGVDISVPADVTREELVRLAEFVRLLPTR